MILKSKTNFCREKQGSGSFHQSASPPYRSLLTAHCSPSFTLVELMVVVAIIAMLIMLLAPQLHNARNRARSTKCQNNLRQYGVAVNQYISDWSGYFILPSAGGASTGGKGTTALIDVEGGQQSMTLYTGFSGGDPGLGGSIEQDVNDFINGYISTNLCTENMVSCCPEADLDVFVTNKAWFKGFYFDSNGRAYDDNYGKYSTYGINGWLVGQARTNIPDSTMAFADWNIAQGWGMAVYYTTQNWQMARSTVGPACQVLGFYTAAGNGANDYPLKGAPGYLTELGFRHKLGKKLFANYVAFDGHVGSVDFPDAILKYMNSSQMEYVRKGYFSDLGPFTVTASVESNFYRVFYGVDKP